MFRAFFCIPIFFRRKRPITGGLCRCAALTKSISFFRISRRILSAPERPDQTGDGGKKPYSVVFFWRAERIFFADLGQSARRQALVFSAAPPYRASPLWQNRYVRAERVILTAARSRAVSSQKYRANAFAAAMSIHSFLIIAENRAGEKLNMQVFIRGKIRPPAANSASFPHYSTACQQPVPSLSTVFPQFEFRLKIIGIFAPKYSFIKIGCV